MNKINNLIIGALLLVLTTSAHAVLISGELPENAYIQRGGYDIAWINPWSVGNSSGLFDLAPQAAFGWQLMPLAIYNAIGGLTAADFSFEGANVDYVTGNNLDEASGAYVAAVNCCGDPTAPIFDVAIATPWFSDRQWGDWGQAIQGQWSLADTDIGGGCEFSCNETLAYRVSRQVPESATLALMGLGLFGLGFSRRKKA